MSGRMAVHFGSLERLLCNLWHDLTGWLLTTPSNSAAISCIPRVSKSSGNKAAWNCFKRIYLHIRHFHRLGSWQGLHKVYTKPCCCSQLCTLRPPETCPTMSNTPGFTKVPGFKRATSKNLASHTYGKYATGEMLQSVPTPGGGLHQADGADIQNGKTHLRNMPNWGTHAPFQCQKWPNEGHIGGKPHLYLPWQLHPKVKTWFAKTLTWDRDQQKPMRWLPMVYAP